MPDPSTLAPSALDALADARRALDAGAPVARVALPWDVPSAADPLAWLAAQEAAWRFFWHARGADETVAAAGTALELHAESFDDPRLDALQVRLPGDMRLYGTARFDLGADSDDAWAPFGAIRFVVPRFELRYNGARTTLALHITPEDTEAAIADALASLRPSTPLGTAMPEVVGRDDRPDRAGWQSAVEDALDTFGRGTLEKVVLARRTRLSFDAPPDPFSLFSLLRAATPQCYHALVTAGDAAFLSATPERLFRLDGRRVATEAVAGTALRADAPDADARLRDALLHSEKDLREHAYVRDTIAEVLAPLTEGLIHDGADTLALARKRHLYTRLDGTLRDGATALDLLRALHPTPAVGGTPREAARDVIARLEGFDRGLYAGPLGWLGRDAAEFAVGIRSGLVQGETLDLFAGAGIVAGSEAGKEWAEVESKIGGFLQVLGLT